jgi:dihydrodipicolinate synthase/N-acetylneuraminate lyase
MQALTSSQIHGTWGTVLLPINADESIDYERLGDEIDHLIAARLDGLYTNGTAGEFYTQTEQEFNTVAQLVAERCERAGMPFQLGVSHTSAQVSLERLRRAVELRPSAVQVILPDWVALTEEEAIAFLERMAEAAAPVPLVLYNPPHAKRVLDPVGIGRLRAAVPSLVSVKVLDGGPSWYAAIRQHLRDCAVFVPGHHLATGVLNGAQGSYSNVACLSPRGTKRWNNLMYTDIHAALVIERKILAFFQAHIVPIAAQGYSNPALDKLLAAIGGWANIGMRLRWPYRSIPDEVAHRLAPIAREMMPELFDD